MILTGKAKEDFLKWVSLNRNILVDYHENHVNSDIIEWFDSVGIYISISHDTDVKGLAFWSFIGDIFLSAHHTRQEATKQAILKCNIIYNESLQTRR